MIGHPATAEKSIAVLRRVRRAGLAAFGVGAIAFLCAGLSEPADAANNIGTFSIVALDPKTGDLGVGVQSRYFAVGSVVPHAKAGVGAVATQALGKLSHGTRGLDLLARGMAPAAVLETLLADDPDGQKRQVGLIDAAGRTAIHTGGECLPWAGGRTGKNYAVQGNILTGPEVVDAMAETFEAATGDLANRIMASLKAGQKAGGDKRGRQSAALLIVRKDGGYGGENDRYIDLHVEDHATPIQELQRLLRIKRGQLTAIETDRLLARLQDETDPAVRKALLEQTLEHAKKAVQLNVRDGWAWLLLARARLLAGKTDAAARAGVEAVALNPALKKMRPRTRTVLGLDEKTLKRLLGIETFRRAWNALPAAP
ncbi:MAG: DUF1028 domain-containing protein [Rhodospirillales bacterium]